MNTEKEHNDINIKNLRDSFDRNEYNKVRNKMIIALRISELIKEKIGGKSEFATLASKKPSQITAWTSGDRNFTIDTLTEICNLLEVDLFDLFKKESRGKTVYAAIQEVHVKVGHSHKSESPIPVVINSPHMALMHDFNLIYKEKQNHRSISDLKVVVNEQ